MNRLAVVAVASVAMAATVLWAEGAASSDRLEFTDMPASGLGIPVHARVPLDTIMGNLAAKGVGVRQDYAEAVRRFRLAADRGDASAQYNLGVLYAEGVGVPRDFVVAITLFREAAAQGVADARYNLGLMYDKGQGVRQDRAAAATWFGQAADQGHSRAQYHLGIMFALGQGLQPSLVRAHLWFDLAATGFPAAEAENRDKAIAARERVAALMTQDQIAAARRMADEWEPGRD